jgi:methionine sulfoxide reductase catalytic subunit
MWAKQSTELRGERIASSEITPRAVFEQRRRLLQLIAGAAAAVLSGTSPLAQALTPVPPGASLPKLAARSNAAYSVTEPLTSYADVTTYNNFYEFGTDKTDPAHYASTLKPRPWHITVDGEVGRPRTYDIDDLLKLVPLEERIYRLRCVEGWSMVIPWIGFPLSEIIKRAQPNGNAKYLQFISLADRQQMPGVSSSVLDWPYSEGLRMDEAMHPLTLFTIGLYGEVLPNQNGAPARIVVPWKYGFKSAKSIVHIRFVEKQPPTSWNTQAAQEYGFYSNVNPQVNHPRWSQATERRVGEGGFFTPKRPTLMFNGYGDQVASLYQGMDLAKFF